MVTGKVTGSSIGKNKAGTEEVRLLQVQISDVDDVQTIEHFSQSGEDTAPAVGDKVIVEKVGTSYKIAGNTKDLITPTAAEGEKKIYSQAGGTIKASVFLKADGSLDIEAIKSSVKHKADGSIDVLIDSAGKITIGNGTDELLNLFNDFLTQMKKLVGATLLSGSVDIPGTASTGTNSLILSGLSTMEADIGTIQTALGNLKV